MKIEEAIAVMLDNLKEYKQQPETVSVSECSGRYLEEDAAALFDVPGFDRSAMDGYAVRSEDIKDAPVSLEVIGEVFAGDHKQICCKERTAVRIMTGGMIPEGYDCVVKQEDTDYGEEIVTVNRSVPSGMNIGLAGEDMKKGTLMIKAGTRLTPAHAGILAGQGIGQVKVKSPFNTALLATGSELTEPGLALECGKIYNSSVYVLSNSIKCMGLGVSGIYSLADDGDAIIQAIQRMKKNDQVIITTGGVSVGKRDLMPDILDRINAKILFRNVDIQPGTPTIGAISDGTLILCLSGNPYAALANFEIYFPEAAAVLMNCESLRPKIHEGIMTCAYEKKNFHRRMIRARFENGKIYLPEASHLASVISNLISCNCMIDLEPGRSLAPGDSVKVRMLSTI